MALTKKISIALIVLIYVGIIGIWCYRFPISYKLTNGTYHDLKVDHDLTQQERDSLNKAYQIRKTVSNILKFSSILISIASYIAMRSNLTNSRSFLKVVMYVSGVIAIILILVDGIHFIPGPPIR